MRAAFKPGLSASKDLAQEKPWVDVRQREIQYSKIAREGVYAEGVDRYHQEGVKKTIEKYRRRPRVLKYTRYIR